MTRRARRFGRNGRPRRRPRRSFSHFVAGTALGIMRAAAVAIALLAFATAIILASPVKLRFRGATPSAWLTTAAARLGLRLLGVEVAGEHIDRIRRHDGLLFSNHVSWLDILVLLSIVPVRFLSAVENRKIPVIGTVAAAIGTVFVDRGDGDSRARAREQVAAAPKKPPLVIFPEGGIADDHEIWPFRYGAFELAASGSITILPVVLAYEQPEHTRWGTESLPASVWRTMSTVPVQTVVVDVLEPVPTTPADDPEVLATEVHRVLADHLGLPHAM